MKSLQKRATVGAILVVGVGLAFLLRNLGMGIGSGNGSDEGNLSNARSDASSVKVDIVGDAAPEQKQEQPVSTKSQKETSSQKETIPLPDTSQLVTVIVEEKHYLLGTNSTPPKPVKKIALADLLELTKQARGNQQGIRCRVYYLGTSLPSAEIELNNQLEKIGLKQNEIQIEQRELKLK